MRAVLGEANVIVSGDRDLLDLGWVDDIPIISARRFLMLLKSTTS